MLQTKKISNDLVAVSFDFPDILIRQSGKANFGKEKPIVSFRDGKLIINEDTAAEFDIEVVMEGGE